MNIFLCVLILVGYLWLAYHLEFKSESNSDKALGMFMIFPGILFVFAICAFIMEHVK